MHKIKAKKITTENFSKFGSFTDILNPSGNHLGDFYNDQVNFPVSGNMPITFSPLICRKPEKMIVSTVEYHNYTGEGILPLDDDMILHVAPPTKEPVPELTEAFIVPKGTMIKINAGVWHYSAMPVHEAVFHVLIVLPERTYVNDCEVIEYKVEDQIEIEL